MKTRPAATWWTVLVVVWIAAGAYAFANLNRGWVPHDEGQFGLAAERVLAGELPHRDFDEMYTGGLTHLNALAFRAFGVTVESLRIVLFVFFLLWVPAMYYVASRFGSALLAGGVTVLAVAWSIPNYSAPVPSWYNLFFAGYGLAALMRYLETDQRRWLFAAGLCGGLSFLIKLVGVYYVAGVLLFLLVREQSLRPLTPGGQAIRERYYSFCLAAALLAFIAIVARTYHRQTGLTEFSLFVVPNGAIAAFLMWRETQQLAGSSSVRFRALLAMSVPFLAGVVLPVALYLVPYATAGGLHAFLEGVFILPGRRLMHATYPLPDLDLVLVLPMLALIATALFSKRQGVGVVPGALALNALAFVLVASRFVIPLYLLALRPTVFVTPLAVLAGLSHLRHARPARDVIPQRVMLVLCVTAMCSLVQFPFPAPIYFCYVAPLAGLALAVVIAAANPAGRALGAALLVFYAAFAVWRVTPGFIYAMGQFSGPDQLTARLELRRAPKLLVHPDEAREYQRVIALATELASKGRVYAFPDCPEVYFLSGLHNPTRTMYEVLGKLESTDQQVAEALADGHVHAIVINGQPAFSKAPSPQLLTELRDRFPHVEVVGRFEVRWLE